MHDHPQNRWSNYADNERQQQQQRRDDYQKEYDDYDGYDNRYAEDYNREYQSDRRSYAEQRSASAWQQQQNRRQPVTSANFENESRGIARIQISQPDNRNNSHHDDHYDDCEDDYSNRRIQHQTPRQPDRMEHGVDRRQMDRQPTSSGPPAAGQNGQWRSAQNSNRMKDQIPQTASQNIPMKEPHLRFEHSPAPFHGHNKHDIIDGFQSSNKLKPEDDKGFNRQTKKSDIPPAPPGPAASIKNIINNLKGNASDFHKNRSSNDIKDIPKNKVSTNPFLRNGDSGNGQRFHRQDEMVQNVQEVVQKMNVGEWPIKIEDESNQNIRSSGQRPPDATNLRPNDKARQWETLDRRSPNIRNSDRCNPRMKEDKKKFSNQSDSDHFSERSDPAENTTVSTDSAMGTDDSVSSGKLPFDLPQGAVIRKMPENVRELNDEAEKLLIYFKCHRNILNYLGIGLSETLWNHVHALPSYSAEIIIETPEAVKPPVAHSGIVKKMEPTPQITVTHAPISPNKKAEKPIRDKSPQKQPGRFNQSPRMNALERELCTDTVDSNTYQNDKSNSQDNRAGRFVKKSAAALIAKKQGVPSSIGPDDIPMPSDFADPRIAAEIQQLREREEELKRSRSELGLPSLDDVMDTWSGKSPIRLNSQNLDYLKQMDNQRPQITKSQSAHNIYIEENMTNQKPEGYFNYETRNNDMYEDRGRNNSKNSIDDPHMRGRFQDNRHEREDQFFRDSQNRTRPFNASSPAQLRPKCVVKGVDITIHSSARSTPSQQHHPNRPLGL